MKTLFILPGACAFGAMVALEWADEPYQVSITTPEIRESAAFRKINPLGKVGALVDNQTVVYESLAILFYLADQMPNSPAAIALNSSERTKAYTWLSYLASTLHATFRGYFFPHEFVDASYIETFKPKTIQRIKDILAYIDAYLADNDYFISSKPTIVDAHAYGIIRWSDGFCAPNEFPAIKKFMERMGELPAVKNALYIEQNKPDLLVNSPFAGYYTLS